MLGSFDPPHLGHEWILRQLLRRFDQVLVLLPGRHFEKRIVAGANATLDQRRVLLDRAVAGLEVQPANRGRLVTGLTHEVLFVRLVELARREIFPGARQVSVAVGVDTARKLARSARYFARLGLPWGAREQQRLARIQRQLVVFARASAGAPPRGALRLPPSLGRLSSTLVRHTVRRVTGQGAGGELEVRRSLEGLVSGGVARLIAGQRLYRPPGP